MVVARRRWTWGEASGDGGRSLSHNKTAIAAGSVIAVYFRSKVLAPHLN